jgi:hypothetical protein
MRLNKAMRDLGDAEAQGRSVRVRLEPLRRWAPGRAFSVRLHLFTPVRFKFKLSFRLFDAKHGG